MNTKGEEGKRIVTKNKELEEEKIKYQKKDNGGGYQGRRWEEERGDERIRVEGGGKVDSRNSICVDFKYGNCNRGEHPTVCQCKQNFCNKYHIREIEDRSARQYQTRDNRDQRRECRFHMTGYCKYGDGCHYQHTAQREQRGRYEGNRENRNRREPGEDLSEIKRILATLGEKIHRYEKN